MLYDDLIDIPIEVFGGYVCAIPPQDLPPGASPLCRDVFFPQAAVKTRGGLQALYPGSIIPNNASINGLKTYLTPTLAQRLIIWDSLGNLYKENPQGAIAAVANRPQAAGLLYQSTTLFGREYQTFSAGSGGADISRQFDDTYWDRVTQCGVGAPPSAIDSGTAGNIAVGLHQVSVAFITRQGWIGKPSPPGSWTAAGNKQVDLMNIALGPSNVVARLILFTPVITAPATTGSFYSTPTGTTQLATPTVMLIADNVTTALTVDFTDAILIASFQANYLFTQRELGECSFTGGYNSRTLWLGERNNIQNLLNISFDGGFTSAGAVVAGSAGPNTCGGGVDGGSDTPWANPGNIAIAGQFAEATGVLDGGVSDYLYANGFGFAIPSNATINGITAVITKAIPPIGGWTAVDNSVLIVKGGLQQGVEHASSGAWLTAFTPTTYGNAVDLWGVLWTPADINDPLFGVAISVLNTTGGGVSADPQVQAFVTITVSYTTPQAGAVGPLGWTQTASYAGGGQASAGGFLVDWGDAFSITGNGATAVRGKITQSAYQDYLLNPIIARNTAYRVRARLAKNNTAVAGAFNINLQSTTGAFTTEGMRITTAQIGAAYVEFDALLTGALMNVPADLLLQVYVDGTPTNNGVFIVDSIEVYPATSPYNYSTAWLSHAFNPESLDNTQSQVQVRPNDGQQLHAGFPLRNSYYLAKDHYLCYVTDDGINEPAQWQVTEVSATIGICGSNAVDYTEEWAVFAERSGLYLCWGSDPVKITPEIQTDASKTGKIAWDSINWQYDHTIWVRIDKVNKQILVGAPVNGATSPNVVFVLDYQFLNSAQDIADSPVVVYSSFSGKMIAHGRGRKWSIWTIAANAMTFAERTDGTAAPFFGNGSGLGIGAAGNGLIYQQLDATVQASDNGVAINSFWNSYYSPAIVEEQMTHMSAKRKLLGYLTWRASGAGALLLSIQAANRVTNLRNYTLFANPVADAGRAMNLHGERFSISLGTDAVGAWFQLEKLCPFLKKDATIPVRGRNA